MRRYRFLVCCGIVGILSVSAFAEPTLDISLGTRETGSTAEIGADGGTSGSIEWVDLAGQSLVLNDTWQQFTFDMDTAPLTGFTGDGILDGAAGTVEHIRFDSLGFAGPITIWIDEVADAIDPPGPPPAETITFGDFEGYLDGDEVIFQEPSFSGSTAAHLLAGSVSGVDSSVAFAGDASYKVDFQFVDGDPSRWLRLTTFQTPNLPNPTIAYDQDSVVSFWMKGVPEPSTALLLGLPAVALLRRRR